MTARDHSWQGFAQSLTLCDETRAFLSFLRQGLGDDLARAAPGEAAALRVEADHVAALDAEVESHRADLLAFRVVHDELHDRVAALEAALAARGVDPALVPAAPAALAPPRSAAVVPLRSLGRASAALRGVLVPHLGHRGARTA